MGTIYLIHFSVPLYHARHYVGYTRNRLEDRIEEHKQNRGARILAHLNSLGIEWKVVKTWNGDRNEERRLKKSTKSCFLCPICREEKLEHAKNVKRKWRDRKRNRL
jgi:predicted GIY-YIG superfamily endonuclease